MKGIICLQLFTPNTMSVALLSSLLFGFCTILCYSDPIKPKVIHLAFAIFFQDVHAWGFAILITL